MPRQARLKLPSCKQIASDTPSSMVTFLIVQAGYYICVAGVSQPVYSHVTVGALQFAKDSIAIASGASQAVMATAPLT